MIPHSRRRSKANIALLVTYDQLSAETFTAIF
jgi:hypothetical protein